MSWYENLNHFYEKLHGSLMLQGYNLKLLHAIFIADTNCEIENKSNISNMFKFN